MSHLSKFIASGEPGWPSFQASESVMSLSPGHSGPRSLTDYEKSVEQYFMSEVKQHLCYFFCPLPLARFLG